MRAVAPLPARAACEHREGPARGGRRSWAWLAASGQLPELATRARYTKRRLRHGRNLAYGLLLGVESERRLDVGSACWSSSDPVVCAALDRTLTLGPESALARRVVARVGSQINADR